jgi:hypothetical protein
MIRAPLPQRARLTSINLCPERLGCRHKVVNNGKQNTLEVEVNGQSWSMTPRCPSSSSTSKGSSLARRRQAPNNAEYNSTIITASLLRSCTGTRCLLTPFPDGRDRPQQSRGTSRVDQRAIGSGRLAAGEEILRLASIAGPLASLLA